MKLKKKLSVKGFTQLVGHHSEGNIRVFRERLRLKDFIKNNEPLTEDLVPIWYEICKVHEQGATWVEAMDHVLSTREPAHQESDAQPEGKATINEDKMDEIILLLKEILVELRKNNN